MVQVKLPVQFLGSIIIRAKGELRDYYKLRVGEGKSKMAVLNAVRNKLIGRVYAVVSKNQEYDKTYAYSLAGTIEISK